MSGSPDSVVSIVIPARNEAKAIAETLGLLREPEVLEVIVVDGESHDGTADRARSGADRVLSSPPGRARQMNAGARAARGEILFFLHADTRVPPGFARAIVEACRRPGIVGGRFDVSLDAPGTAFRLLSTMINLRSRLTRIFTGDQGLFVRRAVFERLGGYPDRPILEDLALSIAMKREGMIACLRERLVTSARRWQQCGIVRTVLLMWTIRGLHALGVSAERLARLYRDVR